MNELYKERLIEIYSEKKNFGHLKEKTHEIKGKNPFCDDEIIIELNVKNGKIKDARFSGKTCFVSTISTEVLLENIKGMNIEDLKELNKKSIDDFLGIEISPSRASCELFPLETLKKSIQTKKEY